MPPVAVEALAGVVLPDRVSIAATKSLERGADTHRIGVAGTDEAIRAGFEGDRLAVDDQRVGSSDRNGEGRADRSDEAVALTGPAVLELGARGQPQCWYTQRAAELKYRRRRR